MDYCVKHIDGEWENAQSTEGCEHVLELYPPWQKSKHFFIEGHFTLNLIAAILFICLAIEQKNHLNKKSFVVKKRIAFKLRLYLSMTTKSVSLAMFAILGSFFENASLSTSKGKLVASIIILGTFSIIHGCLISTVATNRVREIAKVEFGGDGFLVRQKRWYRIILSVLVAMEICFFVLVLNETIKSLPELLKIIMATQSIFALIFMINIINCQYRLVKHISSVLDSNDSSARRALGNWRKSISIVVFLYIPVILCTVVIGYSNMLWNTDTLFYLGIVVILNLNLFGDLLLAAFHIHVTYGKRKTQKYMRDVVVSGKKREMGGAKFSISL